MPVDETRAVAKLPQLDIEIRHRQVPEEGAEYLSISLRATPGFDQAMALLDPFRLVAAWASLNPWLALANPLAFWALPGRAPALTKREGGAP